jgi:hypothetical protein
MRKRCEDLSCWGDILAGRDSGLEGESIRGNFDVVYGRHCSEQCTEELEVVDNSQVARFILSALYLSAFQSGEIDSCSKLGIPGDQIECEHS